MSHPNRSVRIPLAGIDFSRMGRTELKSLFWQTLEAGLPGLCFSPYEEGQKPGSHVTPEQIRARLEVIRPYTRWVRSFSCTEGHEETGRIAHELGMKTLVGVWLGTDAEKNEEELQAGIRVAHEGHADLLAVGNEVLLREDLPADELASILHRVKQAVPDVPVGYVDAYYLFEQNPTVTDACDVVFSNCYPFWEGCAREYALLYMKDMYARAQRAARGKKVIISETGWPNLGTSFWGATPSWENALQYFLDTQKWAQEEGIDVFWFSAFDEAWKTGPEGDVGASWGLWDKDGKLKFR